MDKWIQLDIEYRVGKDFIKFKIEHTLPNTLGLHFDNVFNSWLYKTNEHNAKSLCNYINEKANKRVCREIN